MRNSTLFTLVASIALVASGQNAAPPSDADLWRMPAAWPQHCQLRGQLIDSMRRGDIRAMENTCRAALELMPSDPTWRYNLACALAYGEAPGLALTELEKAVEAGFHDADAIAADRDLSRIADEPRFAEIVRKARALREKSAQGRPAKAPASIPMGGVAVLTSTNVVWNFDFGCFEALLETKPPQTPLQSLAPAFEASRPASREKALLAAWISEGTAAGNGGDVYFNRDNGHSVMELADYPLMSAVRTCDAGIAAGAAAGHPNTLFNGHAVFGNVSLGRLNNPYWRSMGRASMTAPGMAQRMELIYRNNQFWVFPSVKDHDPAVQGDIFPGSAPFQLVTEGMSWSDLPYLRAAAAASAAFRPQTKAEIMRLNLMGPTMQWLFRRTRPGVRSEADYFTAKAHPTAFAPADLDAEALVKKAHALKPDRIPPMVALSIVNSRVFPIKYPAPETDYPDVLPELLYNTPSAISFTLRAPEGVRTFLVQAQAVHDRAKDARFKWAVVHGDPALVRIAEPLGSENGSVERGFAQIVLDRRTLTNRVDVACFAKTPNSEYGAPAIVSFYPVPQEKRIYREDGRLASIDYTNAEQVYCDPFIALPRRWKDVYSYSAKGKPLGFTRFVDGREAASFTAAGERILERRSDGSPAKTVRVKYVPRKTDNPISPMELTYVDDGEPIFK